MSRKVAIFQDKMASPMETPQEFKYETRFVVLNYLGILPKFEEIVSESDNESDDLLGDDDAKEETMSFGLRSQTSSQDTTSSLDSDSCSRDSEEFRQIRRIAAEAIAMPSQSPPTVPPSAAPEMMSAFSAPQRPVAGAPLGPVSGDTCEGLILPTHDIVKDTNASPSPSPPVNRYSASPPAIGSRTPSLKISSVESPRSRRAVKKRKSKDVMDDSAARDRMHHVLSELETQFKKDMVQEGLDSSGVLCAISREALVAERIAQIGDCIMMHHHNELESAYEQLLGNGGQEPINYGVFKGAMKSLVKNTVPGWYHVAVMMQVTRKLAVNMLDQGSRGIAAVTDYAARYIEENLAQSIIEQGGWDALTNVDLDKIDSETWSDISSGNPSPQGVHSPIQGSPPLYMDESGHLSPRLSQSGTRTASTSQSGASAGIGSSPSQQHMAGLNEATGIKAETENQSGSRPPAGINQSGSGSPGSVDQLASPSRPARLGLGETQMDHSGRRKRVQSERAPSSMDDFGDEPPRGRATSFGAAVPIIATAAAATATVAAVAAVGAYALLKK